MKVGVIGAGIAGLSVAWLLNRRGVDVTVFEREDRVGGLARSFQWHGFTCDFAAHRLFTENESVLQQLLALVPMGRHIRRSQIRLSGRWLHDPVNIGELMLQFFPKTAAAIALGYLTRPRTIQADSFESYVRKTYGDGLDRFFFAPYTEKIFGIPGCEIALDWAVRKVRIAGPLDAIRASSKKNFSYFYYPMRGGYGAICNKLASELGGRVRLGTSVVELTLADGLIGGLDYEHDGQRSHESFDQIISTLPLPILGRLLGYQFELSYRPVQAVYLLIDRPLVSDNHWTYFMDGASAINRMVEFKNMSAIDCPPTQTVLCAEVTGRYDDVVSRVIDDLLGAKMVTRDEVKDTMVVEEPFSYPVYDRAYPRKLEAARDVLAAYRNLRTLGRAAEFEHKEVDDNFADALDLVNELCAKEPIQASAGVGASLPGAAETNPLVYAVVLSLNNLADTRQCLQSVGALIYDNFRTVLVDNGSTDGTSAAIRAEFPNVDVIETGQNLGVPRGFNVGITHALDAGADFILMLNNDTTVAPDLLSELVSAATTQPRLGILMPKVLYYDQPTVLWSEGGRYRRFPPAIVFIGLGKPDQNPAESLRMIDYAPSCGLLIRREAFERAGLFDPGYLFYYDDWDFSERVRAQGMEIALVPKARMWHKVSRTTRSRPDLFWRVWGESCVRFYRRHGRPVFLSLPIHLGYILLREVVKGNAGSLGYFLQGARVGLTKPLGPIPTISELELFRGQGI